MQATLQSLLFPGITGELDHRKRLLLGMGDCITERGYSATTIADIVRHAHVSKRTFYEHFADKEACYLETYLTMSQAMLGLIARAATQSDDAEQQLRLAVRTYIGMLESNVSLARSFLTEILGVGPRALAARRDVHGRFAQLLRVLVERACAQSPEIFPLSKPMAIAIVGGINEMLLDTFDSGEEDLEAVALAAFAMIRAILTAPPSDTLA